MSNDGKSLVCAFKGTSHSLFPMKGRMDYQMDSLMFTCCCEHEKFPSLSGCSCQKGNNVCSNTCLLAASKSPKTYYSSAKRLVLRARKHYPHCEQLFFTGHSLGGALASLMAATFKESSAIAFSSPGEAQYAKRLGLSTDSAQILHIGLSIDPIFTGNCTICRAFGFPSLTKCHFGNACTLNNGEKPLLKSHGILTMINYLERIDNSTTIDAECNVQNNCIDCEDWVFEQ